MNLIYDEETGLWDEYEPYRTLYISTEEDWEIFEEAIEKQKARKPISTTLEEDVQIGGAKFCKGTHTLSHCPACGAWIVTQDNYCKHCGQKLDWSEESEE